MPGALEAVDAVLSDADSGDVTTAEAIERLLGAQITLRNNRRLQAAMRSSRLPVVKTLDEFDFSFQPSIKREQIDSLYELGFVERKENVVLLGPPGVGKTRWSLGTLLLAHVVCLRLYLVGAEKKSPVTRAFLVAPHTLPAAAGIARSRLSDDEAVRNGQLARGRVAPPK